MGVGSILISWRDYAEMSCGDAPSNNGLQSDAPLAARRSASRTLTPKIELYSPTTQSCDIELTPRSIDIDALMALLSYLRASKDGPYPSC